ncbi:uncharacterized protein LOC114531057 [Dendronephthya gigantea]|uniref:uncharacterized protein LOC114531057 n=1 Tax=Dendronephthya gigantea TaxID=151771 RepID=UPI00106CEC3F|nr:uncharacterized protein LOC114531057 [Dendronephthya gigantea]
MSKNFAIQRQSHHGFAAVACDQTIEQTVNRDAKTKGGLIGFTLNRGAVHRWLLSQSQRAAITSQCKSLAGMEYKPRKRKDLDPTKCDRYEKSVESVITTVSNMLQPFDAEQESLVSLASGFVIDDNVAKSLLGAEQSGEDQFQDFVKNNLAIETPDIFQTIKKNKLPSIQKTKTGIKNSGGKETGLKMSRNLFAKLLLVAKSRDVDMQNILSYCLGAYPLSLASVSGSFLKTAKSKLAEILEREGENPHVDQTDIPHDNALIVDAMAVVQCLKGNWKTFGDFADSVFRFLIKLAHDCRALRLDFVADRYLALSIKNTERVRRATEGVQRVHIYSQEQNIPKQWKKFLSSGENKEALLEFFIKHWKSYKSSKLASVSVLYATSKDKCYIYRPGRNGDDPVRTASFPPLDSNHEEADTRLLLHAKHAASTYDTVIIRSPDTDVLVLCTAMQHVIEKDIYMMTGSGNKFRCIHINTICEKLGEDTCKCLLGFHAFSGCDSTSSFHGKGKVKVWKTLSENPEFTETFGMLGNMFPPSDLIVSQLHRLCV